MSAEQINHAAAVILCIFGIFSIVLGIFSYMFFEEWWQLCGIPLGIFFFAVAGTADN